MFEQWPIGRPSMSLNAEEAVPLLSMAEQQQPQQRNSGRRSSLLRVVIVCVVSALCSLAVLPVVSMHHRYPRTQSDASISHPALIQPHSYHSLNGLLNVTLRVSTGRATAGPLSFNSRLYNGHNPGPTLRVSPGDRLVIHLQNDLEKDVPGHPVMNTYRYSNTTNLHTHGMHVSPKAPADDMFLRVKPGSTAILDYHLPLDHRSGTFW
jgi:FtsP/CotA-like multicopper oxidase with cupredoxin domain